MITQNITSLLPPPFAWCAIPAGWLTLEGAFRYDDNSVPVSEVSAFDMAQYPITNAQFQVFLDAEDGYASTDWWAFSPRAQRWREQFSASDAPFPGDDLPRATVSWFEAVAFCQWLSAKTGDAIRLPTEQEWQRAAQGDDGRRFPWGNTFEIQRCNTSESGIKRPTTVTRYPNGASPYGVMDLCGNTAEWCLNAYNVPEDADIYSFEGGLMRAMRGGSWGLSHFSALNTSRGFNHPADRFEFLGFRIARGQAITGRPD